ncbi:MAG: hypothetical protein EHM87_19555 [Burkholderiales bacterium]|nr:MAG: hypothetical protein EHM87_19555 [Burkholderiales bacterium]
MLEELKLEYATQDNRATAYPIYVTVQELTCIGIMEDGYSVSGDGINKIEYRINGDGEPDVCETKEQAIELLKEQFEDDPTSLDEAIQTIEELNVGYLWTDVYFFLTIQGAEEYMKANAHNHGELRNYVKHFERRNFEMRGLLKEIGFKVED